MRFLGLITSIAIASFAVPQPALSGPLGDLPATYVSPSRGSDVGNCQIAIPCLTVQRAVDWSALNGQVFIVDAGDVADTNTITISQGINIRGLPGGLVRIVAPSGKPAISISLPDGQQVSLLHLQITGAKYGGANAGSIGVEFNKGAALRIIDVAIGGFTYQQSIGVKFTPAASSDPYPNLLIDGGRATNNGTHVYVKPGGGTAAVAINHFAAELAYQYAVFADATVGGNINLSLTDSIINSAANAGVYSKSNQPGGSPNFANVSTIRSTIQATNTAVIADGPRSLVALNGTTVVGNNTGLLAANGGTIATLQNDMVTYNRVDVDAATNLRLLPPR